MAGKKKPPEDLKTQIWPILMNGKEREQAERLVAYYNKSFAEIVRNWVAQEVKKIP